MLSAVALFSCDRSYNEPDDAIKMKYFGVSDGITDGAGSPNIEPSYVTTRELFGLMDISLGELSHKWFIEESLDNGETWRAVDDFDLQIIRENSGIPSTVLEDFDPELYTTTTPISSPTDQKSILGYFDKGGHYRLRVYDTFDEEIQYYFQTWDLVEGKKTHRYFYSEDQGNGEHLVERDFEFRAYMLPEGACHIYRDAAMTDEIEFDHRSQENIMIEATPGTTFYFKEISGDDPNFDYDYIDHTEWVAEYYAVSANPATPTSLPIVSDVNAKTTSITFDQAGGFRIVMKQKYDQPAYVTGTSFPGEMFQNPIPITFNIKAAE